MHGRELVTGILNILKPDVVEHTLQVNVVTHWSGPFDMTKIPARKFELHSYA